MSHRILLVFAVVAALLLPACESVFDGSKDEFSKEFTCPLDRVEAHARPELHRSDLKPKESPPKDIAADPDRLRMWQAQQAKVTAGMDSRDEIIELRGCGHQVVYACHRFKGGNSFFCSTVSLPPNLKSSW